MTSFDVTSDDVTGYDVTGGDEGEHAPDSAGVPITVITRLTASVLVTVLPGNTEITGIERLITSRKPGAPRHDPARRGARGLTHRDAARPHVDCPDVLLEQRAGRGIRPLPLDLATHRLRSMDVYAATSIELKLLTDPTRARILHLIMESLEGRRSVSDLAGELRLRQPTVSHHLKALVEVGLLERNPDGRLVWYSIQPEHADRVAEVLQGAPATGSAEGVLERVTADLSGRFAGVFSPETVARYVQESYTLLAENGKAIRYLPSLASRFAADRLSALAKVESNDLDRTPEVLFVCVQNAGRSQMAAGILRHLAGDTVRVRTAGSEPASTVRSVIVAALDEIGVSIGGEFPKPLTDEVVRAADVVITMGCGDACPIYPGRRYLDWDVGDPVGLPIGRVRDIRDDIEARVRSLLATLQVNAV